MQASRPFEATGGHHVRPFSLVRDVILFACVGSVPTRATTIFCFALTWSGWRLTAGSCVDERRQKNVSESINAESIEVVLGKIQLEATSEISDSAFQLVSAQSGNGCCLNLKTAPRTHPHYP